MEKRDVSGDGDAARSRERSAAREKKPRIREYIGSVIGGRVPASQGSSGPCVHFRKPSVRSLYTYVAS